MLEGLFKDLGARLSSENNLSDLTWAMANNFGEFILAFMEFFGFEINAEFPLEIYREYLLSDGSRPDFVVENGNSIFIIESKIYDRYYHFKQYGEAPIPEDKKIKGLGIIVNHKIDNVSIKDASEFNFVVKTWESFIKFLEKKLKENSFLPESGSPVRAYIQYVKEVCSIMELKEIRFNNLYSLFHFHALIKKIIEEFDHEEFEVGLYKAGRANGESWSGEYFSLKLKNGKKTVYPFLGIYYGEEPPTIYLAFEKDWCKDIFFKYKGKKMEEDYNYVETTDWEISFCLKENKYDDFNGASLETQKIILNNFVSKVINEIKEDL